MSVDGDVSVPAALSLQARGDLAGSISVLSRLAEQERSESALCELGRALDRAGRLEEAEAILDEAVVRFPGSHAALLYLAFVKKHQGDSLAARSLLEQGLSIREWAPGRVLLAEIHRQEGDLEESHRHASIAVTTSPASYEAWYGLGLSSKDADPAKALEHFVEATKLAPTFAPGHREAGFVLWRLNRSSEAESQLREAIRLDATDVWSYGYLFQVLQQLRRHREAEKAARRAIELQSTSPLFYTYLGESLAAQGQWDAARTAYVTALEVDVSDFDANVSYGEFLVHRGQPTRAQFYLERARTARPNSRRVQRAIAASTNKS